MNKLCWKLHCILASSNDRFLKEESSWLQYGFCIYRGKIMNLNNWSCSHLCLWDRLWYQFFPFWSSLLCFCWFWSSILKSLNVWRHSCVVWILSVCGSFRPHSLNSAINLLSERPWCVRIRILLLRTIFSSWYFRKSFYLDPFALDFTSGF